MLSVAIICTILMLVVGGLSLYFALDEGIKPAVACASFHTAMMIVTTVLFCLYSPEASLANGGILTASVGVVLIIVMATAGTVDGPHVCKVAVFLAIADFICGMASYINTFDFLAMGISCMVILVLSFFACAFVYDTDKSLGIVSIIFTVVAGITGIVGFIINATIIKEVKAEAECSIYKYDTLTSSIGEKEYGELYYNDYYAMQIEINWSDLRAFKTSSEQVKIEVTFPAGILNCISEGPEFTSNTNKTVWTYEIGLNSKSNKKFVSGYFVFCYDFSAQDIGARAVKISVSAVKDGEEEDGIFVGYENEYKLAFVKRSYPFGASDCIKDLSFDEDGHYRITVPVGCETFEIAIYNSRKEGVYCEKSVSLTEKYYSLDIKSMLKEGVTESVYNRLASNKESVVVQIKAVGNSNFDDTVLELIFTFE